MQQILRDYGRYLLAIAAAALVLAAGLGVSQYVFSNAHRAMHRQQASVEARMHSMMLLQKLLDAETGQRGYLLTRNQAYLAPYLQAFDELPALTRAVTSTERLSRAALAASTALPGFIEHKVDEMAATLRLHNEGQTGALRQLLRSNEGRLQMQAIRGSLQTLLADDNLQIDQGTRQLHDALSMSRTAVNTLFVLSVALGLLLLQQLHRINRQQRAHVELLQRERDQLDQQVARRTAELTDLTRHQHSVREDERARLARELHDELGALLTAAKLDAARLRRTLGDMSPQAAGQLAHLNDSINQGITLKRRIIEDLRPSSLDTLGLVTALELQAAEFASRTDIDLHLDLQPVTVPADSQITLYRLVQEALTNVAKHARATAVTLSLRPEGRRIRLQVSDNGIGFDPQRTALNTHGIDGMKYRVLAEGGSFQLASRPGHGTRLTVTLPAAQPADPLPAGGCRAAQKKGP